jgi:hypothetical protein
MFALHQGGAGGTEFAPALRTSNSFVIVIS